MRTALVLLSGCFVAGLGSLTACDKGLELGQPADDTEGIAGGDGDGSESGSESGGESSDSATSTTGQTTAPSTTTPDDSASETLPTDPTTPTGDPTGDPVDVAGEYLIIGADNWPAQHLDVFAGESGLIFTFTELFYSGPDDWNVSDTPVVLEGFTFADGVLAGTADGAYLDSVEGMISLDLSFADGVLCGMLNYGFQEPLTEGAGWGYKLDEGVDAAAAESACIGE